MLKMGRIHMKQKYIGTDGLMRKENKKQSYLGFMLNHS